MKKIYKLLMMLALSNMMEGQIMTPVKWKVILEDSSPEEKTILFTATIDQGWHLYDMNLPAGGPVSTSFDYELFSGAERIGHPKPSVQPTTLYDELFGMELRWYSRQVSFAQKIKITDAGKFKIVGEVEFMACNDEMCLPPERVVFRFDRQDIRNMQTPPAPAPADSAGEKEENPYAPLPETLPETAANTNPPLVQSNSPGEEESPLWAPVINEMKAFGDATLSASDKSWLFIFFAGLVGGLLALLTPCVWPMIPMTVSFFLKRTKDRSKALRDALTYGFAIIIIYLSMGLLLTGLFGAGALNELATNAVFNVLFCLLLVVFAVSFFGAFELTLPASWTNKLDRKADSATGALSIFFMAFTLVVVSFSCTGPIIGTLLVQAASMGRIAGPAIGMFGFALALSIPFALFAVFPHWLQHIPKSGGWLNNVKVVLGFLELALALKFLSVADLAYGWRILDREVFLSLWIVIFALLGLYLLGKIRFPHDSDAGPISVARLFLAGASLSFAVYMLPGLWGAPLKSVSAFAPPLHTQDFSLYDSEVHAAFSDYEAGMQYAKQTGKPVMIDFSGYGCVNCRKMEAAVWTDARVKQLLEKDYVLITLFVDDKTRLNRTIEVTEHGKIRRLKTIGDKWSYLQRSKFGANAQPFYVLIDNEGKPLGPSYAYNEDISKYIKFLQDGLANYHP
ncbi:MAG: thioredoxin family protein [Tannerellaceae bacterium]|jgi:thiol:disulfide interchange protein DsbD|nr:thioredoxin family protein [Tannerellaceae bacterium]